MKVLVVSDTHGRDESLEMAVALEQPFDYLIHCRRQWRAGNFL